ncbi:MAG: hypothetical protein ABIJ20_04415 [Nanoarchaeota archaeon]|nr:hypothetical protein [Nanoarchaeota archaeon]MBU1444838.1 hypothetical protein [Nanoarchaeota archaeon]MBU2420006.1 hypothetical protein [Nanoarchaeota archaeon]MBU2475427.1 hypothetical protein [Nanoarchaeota archaeon]
MADDKSQEIPLENYARGTVIAYEGKILMYVRPPPNSQTHRFKELVPNRFMPHLETLEGYEKMREEAEVIGVLTPNQMHEMSYKNSDLEKLLKKFFHGLNL